MNHQQVSDMATSTADRCKEHAAKVLSPEDLELYQDTMEMLTGIALLLSFEERMSVWNECLATLNACAADMEAIKSKLK